MKIEDYIAKAWHGYKKNAFKLIIGMVFIGLITGIIAITGVLASINVPLPLFGERIEQLQNATEPLHLSGFLGLFNWHVMFLFFMIATIVYIVLSAGFVKMADESLTRKTKIATMLKTVRKKGVSALLSMVLSGLIILSVMALCFLLLIPVLKIGGILLSFILMLVVSLFLSLTLPAVVLSNLKPLAAVKKSIHVVRKNFLTYIGIILVFAVIQFVLFFVPILGDLIAALVVGPVRMLTIIAFYKKVARKH